MFILLFCVLTKNKNKMENKKIEKDISMNDMINYIISNYDNEDANLYEINGIKIEPERLVLMQSKLMQFYQETEGNVALCIKNIKEFFEEFDTPINPNEYIFIIFSLGGLREVDTDMTRELCDLKESDEDLLPVRFRELAMLHVLLENEDIVNRMHKNAEIDGINGGHGEKIIDALKVKVKNAMDSFDQGIMLRDILSSMTEILDRE